jgi:hypothetical protein
MKNIVVGILVLGLSGAFISGCNTKDRSQFLTGTIKHAGIDWSANASVPSDYSNADGETIGWCEKGTQIPSVTGLWSRSNTAGEEMYNLGNIDLESVNSYDANLVDTDICDSPLAVGDVWVIKCLDGYVKFKVTSVDENSVDWEVGVEYEYSTTTDFD